MKKIFLVLFISLFTGYNVLAQINNNRTITTALPFLLIVPDARASSMGDIGVSTSADIFSQHHNPAKYAFLESQYSLGVNYTPWMRELVNDMFLGGVTIANRINDQSAWSARLQYFSFGSIQYTDYAGNEQGIDKPNNLLLDGTYAMKLSDLYSMGVTLRYIRSDVGTKAIESDINVVNSFAVDVSGYFQSEEDYYGGISGRWRGGYNISNIGPKIKSSDGGKESFIPTNLKIGGGFDFIMDDYNIISTNIEFNKLLVPTPPVRDPQTGEVLEGKEDNVGWVKGMFQSFGDAPDGFSEELKEFTWGVGVEYLYDKSFALRAGYFNENEFKGARKYFTLGAGFKFKSTSIDLSYLFNSTDVKNPLENTLRFSLSFNFGDLYDNY
ncbi:MAG: type IX secretion system outer membrane channel protein PorV [Flavobacteriaceae bacterium]|nr:type IX secretion system outer membrane channel protein PorV [Flavobacteriaceae bacterium]